MRQMFASTRVKTCLKSMVFSRTRVRIEHLPGWSDVVSQVVSFINMKGGVGKTTLAVNVAYGLAQLHRKQVLLVDCDPQFNSTQYLLEDDDYLKHISDKKKGTLRDVFVPRQPGNVSTVRGLAKPTNKTKMAIEACTCRIFNGGPGRGRLDLIPSTLNLMDIEFSRRGTERNLKAYLEQKAIGYDYVLIDCPPTISVFTQAAILASDKYLVPIKPDPLSVIGLPLLEVALQEYCDDAGQEIESAGIVFTLVRGPAPTRMQEVMADLRAERGEEVFDSELGLATVVAESVEYHQPVFQFRRRSKAARQIVEITEEFLQRTGG